MVSSVLSDFVLVGLGTACSVFSSSDVPVSTERFSARSHLLRAAAGGGPGLSRPALTASVLHDPGLVVASEVSFSSLLVTPVRHSVPARMLCLV
jgi:hypothetical protein